MHSAHSNLDVDPDANAPAPEPASVESQSSISTPPFARNKCWDLLVRWASDEDGLTLPIVLESLKEILGDGYRDEEWMPRINAVLNRVLHG